MPPLVFAGEARSLQTALGQVAAGQRVPAPGRRLRRELRRLLAPTTSGRSCGHPADGGRAHLLARRAGREGRPHRRPVRQAPLVADSSASATSTCPSFRGHIVNDPTPTEAARVPDPERLVQAYHQSASTLNLLRAFTKGGFADLARVHAWTQEFVAVEPGGPALRAARRRDRPGPALHAGLRHRHRVATPTCTRSTSTPATRRCILGYEEALTRQDSLTGGWYDCSAHMLWIGERTRQLDGAHVEFLRGVGNPIGCKIGPDARPPSTCSSCASALNPARIPGRLTLITRMGADHVEDALRPLLRAVARRRPPGGVGLRPDARQHVHRRRAGRKTRHFDDIVRRDRRLRRGPTSAEGTWPGGIHVELTGDNVTECLGGADEILDSRARRPLRDGVRPAAQRPPEPRPGLPGRRAAPRSTGLA